MHEDRYNHGKRDEERVSMNGRGGHLYIGGCPHTAIGEDGSMNLAAFEAMKKKFPRAELCFVESGGDYLAPTSAPNLQT